MIRRTKFLAVVAVLAGCGARETRLAGPSVLPSGSPKVVAGELDGGPLLQPVAEEAKRLGAGSLSVVLSRELSGGERSGAFVVVPKDVCLIAFARASSSVDDIDLAAFADDGNPVAIDEAPDARPTVVICPPHPDRVYVAVHVAEGEGLVAVGAQYVTRERGLAVAHALGARGALGGTARRPESWPGLDSAMSARRDALGGSWDELRRVALSVDASTPSVVALTLDAEQCVDALVLGDDDVSDLDVDLRDRTGRIVGRSRENSASRFVTVCSREPWSGNLTVRPHAGRGLAAVVLNKAKFEVLAGFGKDVAPILVGEGKPLADLRKVLENSLLGAGYGAPTKTIEVTTVAGRRTASTVAFPKGEYCYRIDAMVGAPGYAFDLTTRFDTDRIVTKNEAIVQSVSFVCGGGTAVVEAEPRGRGGKMVFTARREPWSDPELSRLPVAAGRMLSRALNELPRAGERALKVTRFSLEAGKRASWETSVPAGKCVRAAIGSEGPGTGLELRVFDLASDEELDRAHGVDSALVRACAKRDARTLKFELNATAGHLDAIVGERIHD